MRTRYFAPAVAAFFACTCVHAQGLEQPAPAISAKAAAAQPKAFAGSNAGPFAYIYNGASESTTAFDTAFDSYRTDPKLMAGVALRQNLAIEAGYANLFSRGFHVVEYGRADERAGALGTRGFSSYLAAKLTVPVSDQLSAHGKLGMAYSQRISHDPAGLAATEVDVGPYANIGARYKLNDRATISGELTHAGNTANKWGGASNGTGASATLKVGF
jgi:hypothetical protein